MRIVQRRQRAMHGIEHALILLRPGDREHIGIRFLDLLGLRAHAAGDDHLAVLGHGFADGTERLLFCTVEKAAGVDDHQIRAVMLARQLIALGSQARNYALGVHKRFGASE